MGSCTLLGMGVNEWKKYQLYPCNVAELSLAADHVYLIVGFLNKKKWYIEKMTRTKMWHLGPKSTLF